MPRRYKTGSDGISRRAWDGKLPEEFSGQDIRAFIADTEHVINSYGKEHLHMAKSNTPAAAEQAAASLKLEARAYPLEEPKGSTVAFAGLTIQDSFAVHGIKIINGEKGMFVAMPGAKDKNGEYRDVAFPVTAQARKDIGAVVLDAYAKTVEKTQPELAAAARSAKEALEKPSLTGQVKEAAKEAKTKPAPAKDKGATDKSEGR